MRDAISHARLLEVLAYDPATGIFTWKIRRGQRGLVGTVAGADHGDGYLAIKIDGISYLAHRLAWFYITGRWPDMIDHVDTVKFNNAFGNFREATNIQNLCNKGKNKNNTSGFKGVHLDRSSGRWRAVIKYAGKRFDLGRFSTPEEAHEAYKTAAPKVHGEFARAA